MIVLSFGSEVSGDDTAIKICNLLKDDFPQIRFVTCSDPAEILKYDGDVLILDVVKGIDHTSFVDIDSLKERKIYTIHDFDLTFFLKLTKQEGKPNVTILGIPYEKRAEDTINEVRRLLNEFCLKKMR